MNDATFETANLAEQRAEEIICEVTAVFADSLLKKGKSSEEVIRLLGETSASRIRKVENILSIENESLLKALMKMKADKLLKAVQTIVNIPRPDVDQWQKEQIEKHLGQSVKKIVSKDVFYIEEEIPDMGFEENSLSLSMDEVRSIFGLDTEMLLDNGETVHLKQYPDYCEIRSGSRLLCRFDPKEGEHDFKA